MDNNLNLLLQPEEPDGNSERKSRQRRLNHDLRNQFFCSIAEGNMEKLDKILHIFQVTRMKLTEPWLTDSRTGKTCLMKALLNLNDNTRDIVEKLIEIAERNDCLKQLINAEYIDKDYKGQTALHIAIERRCPDIVCLLLERGADVNAKAKGMFFRKRHGFYFGELPLALAACTNQPEIVTLLMANQRTKVGEQDSKGNTVLHALVTIADDTEDNTIFVTEMYNKILIESKENDLEEIKNVKGLTPLQLAAKLGKFEIFRNILRREMKDKQHKGLSRKITDWAYGPVSSSLYNITGVDTFEKNSVLKIVVFNTRIQNRHMLLSVEPLNTLLEQKWEKFAFYMFTGSWLLYMSYVVTFTAVYYNRSHMNESLFQMNATTTSRHFGGQIFIVIWTGVLFIMEIVMISQLRLSALQSLMTDAWFHILFFLQAGLVACAAILHWVGAELHLAALVVALALGWINILYYTRGFQSMGIYSVMLQKVDVKDPMALFQRAEEFSPVSGPIFIPQSTSLTDYLVIITLLFVGACCVQIGCCVSYITTILLTDVVQFLSVYLLFLIGFAAALASLIQKCSDERECSPFDSFNTAVLELFKLTIGLGDLEVQSQATYPQLFLFLLVVYVVLTFILLLNMLIALMGETVGHISKESKNIWKLQRARTILNLEKFLPRRLKEKFQMGEEINGKRYIRINEVNWTKWNTRVARIHEDPGKEEQDDSVDESSDETVNTLPPPPPRENRKALGIWGKSKLYRGSSRKYRATANSERRQVDLQSELVVVLELNTTTALQTVDCKEADSEVRPSKDMPI